MKQGLANIVYRIARVLLVLFVFIAIFHKFLVNDLPITGRYNGKLVFPVVQDYLFSAGLVKINPRVNINEIQRGIPTLIPFNPYEIDQKNAMVKPGVGGHCLGTDHLGRDVAAGIIYGFWIALLVGVLSIAMALMIAMVIGVSAAYFRKFPLKMGLILFLWSIIVFIVVFFYLINEWHHTGFVGKLLMVLLGVVLLLAGYYLSGHRGSRSLAIPVDTFMNKLIEIRESIPSLFLVLGMVALFEYSSIWNIVLIIGIIGWSNLSRYIRAEVMSVLEENYIKSAIISGTSRWKILVRHILPNALDPVIALVAFSIASAVLLEASLSFLGIGVPMEQPTWGSLLSGARKTNAWWLAVFPGICIFILVTCLSIFADQIQKNIDPRLRV